MNSSTSSSEPKHPGTMGALTIAALVLVAAEISLRLLGPHLSADVRHILSIPATLAETRATGGPSMIVLGNSLSRAGISSETLIKGLRNHPSASLSVARIHPDDTTILDWYYIYLQYLDWIPPKGNILLMPYAAAQLEDGQTLHIDRLASHFIASGSIIEFLSNEASGLDQIAPFLLNRSFRLFSYRERLSARVLSVIPGYQTLAQKLNQQAKQPRTGNPGPREPQFRKLSRLLSKAKSHNHVVVFAALPLPAPYPIPESLLALIASHGMHHINLQDSSAFAPNDFPDGFHLSQDGAHRLTSALVANLSGLAQEHLFNSRPFPKNGGDAAERGGVPGP